jgi:hypothetical protein
LPIRYAVTGAVASVIYGEPRLTNDIDLILDLLPNHVDDFATAFQLETFYCPPPEVIHAEICRANRGHFNIIHHETGFKADIYASGSSELHQWVLSNRKPIALSGETIWVAPVEYVILRKLEYYREGGSEKHIRDISGILEVSHAQINLTWLEDKITSMGLIKEWKKF